jgi:hypothetical protein
VVASGVSGASEAYVAKKKPVDVAVIIPDASPILTLARIGRLDLLETFDVPVHIVDQVKYEVTKPEHDPDGRISNMFKRLGNSLTVIETVVGEGFKAKRAKDPKFSGGNLGEAAVNEYALGLRKTHSASFMPLVLFEDPDVLELRIADVAGIYLINTSAWLFGLYQEGLLPEGLELIDKINSYRKTPMERIDRDARTKKLRATWRRRIKRADPS